MVARVQRTVEIPGARFRERTEAAGKRRTTLEAVVRAAIRNVVEAERRPKPRFRLENASLAKTLPRARSTGPRNDSSRVGPTAGGSRHDP